MSKYLTIGDFILWIAQIACNALALVALLKHRNQTTFPWFASFIGFSVVKALILIQLAIFASLKAYAYAWWAGNILRTILLVAVAVELGKLTFAPISTLAKGSVSKGLWCAGGLTCSVLLLAILMPQRYPHPLRTLLETADRTANLFVCVLMFSVVAMATYTGIPLRKKVYGIAIGFTVMMTADAVSKTLPYLHPVAVLAGLISQTIWLTYLWPKNPIVVAPKPAQFEKMWELIGVERDTHKIA